MTDDVLTPATDHPGVAVHPPFLFLGALLFALVLNWLWPLPIFTSAMGRWSGLLGIVPGVAIVVSGWRALIAAGTDVHPSKPTTAIVRSGPYRFSRNPLYLGLSLIYLGLAMALNTCWAPLLLLPVWLVMHFGVVLREERYLGRKFGENYREYRASVRRYF